MTLYCKHIKIKATKEELVDFCDLKEDFVKNFNNSFAYAVDRIEHLPNGEKKYYILDKKEFSVGWVLCKFIEELV